MSRVHNVDEAIDHVRDYFLSRTPAGDEFPTITEMKSMRGFGGWVVRADFDDLVQLVRVGPRGGLTWLISLTDEEIEELR